MAKYAIRTLLVIVGIFLYCFIPFSSVWMNVSNFVIFFFICLSVYVIEKEEKRGRK